MAKNTKRPRTEKLKRSHGVRQNCTGVDRCRDTGMALVLACLLAMLVAPLRWVTVLAICLLVLTMLRPQLLSPAARIWFGATELLGRGVSSVVLTLIFFLVVTPIGLLRRMTGADAMRKKQWRRATSSVFTTKEHTYLPADMEHPF